MRRAVGNAFWTPSGASNLYGGLSLICRATRHERRGPWADGTGESWQQAGAQDEHEEEGGYASDLPIKVKAQKLQRCVVKTFFVVSEANGKADEQGKGIAEARTKQGKGAEDSAYNLLCCCCCCWLLF